jgi:hypothetical protein
MITPKVACSLARGLWIVPEQYLDKSLEAGHWLEERAFAYEVSRIWRSRLPENTGAFLDWRVLFYDQTKADTWAPVVAAGGGTVVNSKRDEVDPRLTHVFVVLGRQERLGFLRACLRDGTNYADNLGKLLFTTEYLKAYLTNPDTQSRVYRCELSMAGEVVLKPT